MLLIILPLLIIFAFFYILKTEQDLAYAVINATGTTLVATFILLFSALCSTSEVSRTDKAVPIYSLKMKSGISGSFFLGSGGISSLEKYHFYRKNDNGNFQLSSSDAQCTELRETNKEPPSCSWQTVHYKCSPWVIPSFLNWFNFDLTTNETLTIPEGTVIQQFKAEVE